jgi:hypothetical protein
MSPTTNHLYVSEAPPPPYTASVSASTSTPSSPYRFASLSLHTTDCLRLLRFPPPLTQAIHQTILSTWTPGIQETRAFSLSQELKLKKTPWRASGPRAIEATRLISALLRTLHTLGWVIRLSTEISRMKVDKFALLFRYQEPAPTECDWACVVFAKENKIRFIDRTFKILIRYGLWSELTMYFQYHKRRANLFPLSWVVR